MRAINAFCASAPISSEWRGVDADIFLTGEAGSEAGNCEESEKLGETPDGQGVPADVGSVEEPFSLRAAESSK